MTTSLDNPTRPLDVLVVESHPYRSETAARLLADAGHRVHRCCEPNGPDFPCRGIAEPGTCPLDGPIDVALVSRHPYEPRPTRRELGMTCAIRAGVPVVAEGPARRDPFEPWVTERVPAGAQGVVEACERAAGRDDQRLVDAIRRVASPALGAAGVDPADLRCRLERVGASLHVHLTLPIAVEMSTTQALGVRVLDAVRSTGTTYGQVDVYVHPG